VNLPLLHRLGAGIAKVEMAAKKHHTVHGGIRNRFDDYSNNRRRLARGLSCDGIVSAPPVNALSLSIYAEGGNMSRFESRSSRMCAKNTSSIETKKPDVPGKLKSKDWNTENAAFVAAYNEHIDSEGVALEQYRLF
jgi:hypothetical protein